MNYHDIKKLLKSFVQPGIDNEDPANKDNELFIELAGAYQKVEPVSPVKSSPKTKQNNKYIPPGGFIGYRGISVVTKPNREPMQKNVEQVIASTAQLAKDKVNHEAIAKVNDISKWLLQEFEAGRLVYVEPKPQTTSFFTRVKKFLRIK
jgi:uncharacterized protein (DUF2267 family)